MEEFKGEYLEDLDDSDTESAQSVPQKESYAAQYDSARIAKVLANSSKIVKNCQSAIKRADDTQRRYSDLSADCAQLIENTGKLAIATEAVQQKVRQEIQEAALSYEKTVDSRSARKNRSMQPKWV